MVYMVNEIFKAAESALDVKERCYSAKHKIKLDEEKPNGSDDVFWKERM
jgi:hypothetical protein